MTVEISGLAVDYTSPLFKAPMKNTPMRTPTIDPRPPGQAHTAQEDCSGNCKRDPQPASGARLPVKDATTIPPNPVYRPPSMYKPRR